MAVIKDVAKLAGVSPSTVSKYLNNSQTLTQAYKEKVAAAIKELDYTPSPLARSLRTQKTNTIGIIVPEITNPFYTEVYNAVRSAAADRGYTTVLYTTEEDSGLLNKHLKQMSGYKVDGLVLCFIDEDENIGMFEDIQSSLPVTLFSWDINNTSFNSVIVNLFDSVYRSTRYLLDEGHTRIAYAGGPAHSRVSKEKMQGYLKAVQDAGIAVREDFLFSGKYRFQTGYHAAMQFMKLDAPPTAIVCANDILAIGCIKYLKHSGYEVPGDVDIIGLDGIQLSHIYDPSVSTMRIPIDDMSREAVNMLIEKINRPESKNRQAIFNTSLTVRRSTKKDAPMILDL